MHVGSKGKRLRTDVFFSPLIYPTQIVRKTKSRQADSNRSTAHYEWSVESCSFEVPFSMHDSAFSLPRINLPRTPVNLPCRVR